MGFANPEISLKATLLSPFIPENDAFALKEVELNERTVEAFATSVYSDIYTAKEAFVKSKSYWSSEETPSMPVFLWFRFEEPRRINEIAFEEVYRVDGEDAYKVSQVTKRMNYRVTDQPIDGLTLSCMLYKGARKRQNIPVEQTKSRELTFLKIIFL